MHPVLSFTQSAQPEILAYLKKLVECESPSDDAAAVTRFAELVADSLAGAAKVRLFPGGKYGKHLRCEFKLPGRKKEGQVLVLGHSDTVWPAGTLAGMPLREADGRLYGPGVFDMKAGIAFAVFAMRALVRLDIPVARRVVMQLNADEEVGSESSRALTEEEAKKSVAVLVVEPGTGLDGKAKTARKGVGDYLLTVKGRAAHSGVDFSAGASAVLELARQLERIAGFTNLERGLTVNPGVIRGGTRPNVVAGEAQAEIDMRVVRLKDAAPLDRKFRSLKPFDKRCSITVEGGLNRPPMERTPGVVRLYKLARKLAAEIGVDLEESMTGGGSDGNFTAALGIPTLDGIGAVGEGAHAANENIVIGRVADRTALLAMLAAAI